MDYIIRTTRGTFEMPDMTTEGINALCERLNSPQFGFISFGSLGTQKRNIQSIAPKAPATSPNYTLLTADGNSYEVEYPGTVDEAAQKANDNSKAFIEIGGVIIQRMAFDWIIPIEPTTAQ